MFYLVLEYFTVKKNTERYKYANSHMIQNAQVLLREDYQARVRLTLEVQQQPVSGKEFFMCHMWHHTPVEALSEPT